MDNNSSHSNNGTGHGDVSGEHAEPTNGHHANGNDENTQSLLALVRRVLTPTKLETNGDSGETLDPQAGSHARVLKAAEFEELRVEDVMVPRADVVGVDVSASLAEVLDIFADAAHSRLPVYRDTLDDPIGMVHIKDLVRLMVARMKDGGDLWSIHPLESIMHPILAVPASMRAPDLLLRMQTRRIHMAIVADEFGGTDGLATLEDLVEAIIGDIEDEHDEPVSSYIQPRGSKCWDVDARTPISDLEERLDTSLEIDELTEDVDTLGGLVFTLIDRVPERGEVIAHPAGVEFEVTDADPRRIKRLLVRVAALEPTLEPVMSGDRDGRQSGE